MTASSAPAPTSAVTTGVASGWRSAIRNPWLGPAVAIAGAVLLVIAGTLPVWGTRLVAPQYPRGLDLWFFGQRVEGPVQEVNTLNHYIGMQPIDLGRVPEMQLWPLAIVASAFLLAVAILWRGWIGRLALLGLFLVPVVILVDIQRWLMIFGTELDPASALRLDPFVPKVLGPSQVWNFTVWTYPGAALILIWLLALAALLVRRFAPPGAHRIPVLITALAISAVGSALLLVPEASTLTTTGAATEPMASGPVELGLLIASTPTGGMLVVPPGRYRANVVIDRAMTVVADGDVLLDGGGRGSVVTITASDVTLRGLRIAHTGGQVDEAAGIKVIDADRVTIDQNRLEDFYTGIAVFDSTRLRITGNTLMGSGQVTYGAGHATDAGTPPAGGTGAPVSGAPDAPAPDPAAAADPHAGHGAGAGPGGQGDAISLWATTASLVRDNTIHAVRDGLYLNYADQVLVDSNEIHHSRYAVHSMFGTTQTVFGNDLQGNLSGIVLMYTKDVQVGRNTIVDQRSPGTGFGVVLKDVAGVRVAENVIGRNRIGLRAEGTAMTPSAEAAVLRNRFDSNQVALSLSSTSDLGFAANVFRGNLMDLQALEPGIERRNDWTYQGTGNTWDGYRGYDLDGDGVGDVPYTAGGAQQALLTADPALEAYLTSPAMQILTSAQEIWEAARPSVIRDSAPRLDQYAPGPADGRPAAPVAPWLAAGAILVGCSTAVLVAPRFRSVARPVRA